MARKPRVEFEGAKYHVIGRGNYRKPVFGEEGSGEAFERTLFEAAERQGWRIHAFAIMSNHYHVALETPMPNLSEGMGWLLGCFATRFNRFRGEQGHVFQGRYKALLVEPGQWWQGLLDYIHLNPVRAGLCALEELETYRLGSFHWFWQRKRPSRLIREDFLGWLGFEVSRAGLRSYREYLETVLEEDPLKEEELLKKYARGWALASKEYQKDVMKDHEEWGAELGSANGEEYGEVREEWWSRILEGLMQKAGKAPEDAEQSPLSAVWKVKLAKEMKRATSATNAWLAERLKMGHPTRVSALVHGHQMPSKKTRKKHAKMQRI